MQYALGDESGDRMILIVDASGNAIPAASLVLGRRWSFQHRGNSVYRLVLNTGLPEAFTQFATVTRYASVVRSVTAHVTHTVTKVVTRRPWGTPATPATDIVTRGWWRTATKEWPTRWVTQETPHTREVTRQYTATADAEASRELTRCHTVTRDVTDLFTPVTDDSTVTEDGGIGTLERTLTRCVTREVTRVLTVTGGGDVYCPGDPDEIWHGCFDADPGLFVDDCYEAPCTCCYNGTIGADIYFVITGGPYVDEAACLADGCPGGAVLDMPECAESIGPVSAGDTNHYCWHFAVWY